MAIETGKVPDPKENMTDEERIAANSKALMEEEKRQVLAHFETVMKVATEIDQILIRENATSRVWMDIVERFNKRFDAVLPRILIKELKDRYDNRT